MELAATAGFGEDEFWQATPVYFAARQKAAADRRKNELETARFTAWLSIQPHLSKDADLSLTDFYPFPWEGKPKPRFEPVDPEVFKRFHEESERILLADLKK